MTVDKMSLALCRLKVSGVSIITFLTRPPRAAAFSSSSGDSELENGQPKGKEVTMATSSLRIDTVASAGLDISRKKIWEACLDGHVILNGQEVRKKSASVKEGDVIEVDTILDARPQDLGNQGEGEGRKLTKRGRVVVKEIGPKTRKGGYLLTLIRYKQFALFRRNFNSWTVVHFCKKFLEQ